MDGSALIEQDDATMLLLLDQRRSPRLLRYCDLESYHSFARQGDVVRC